MTATAVPVAVQDEAEFAAFVERTCQLVVGMVTVVTGDVAAAEDATQEAYMRAHRRWEDVVGLQRPELWVARVATNIAISSWRRHRRETPLTASAPAPVADAVEAVWARWGLAHLSPQQRRAVVLHHICGMTVDEVASVAGTSPETTRTHLRRGLQRLRRLFHEEDRA